MWCSNHEMDQFPVLSEGTESNAFHQVLLMAVVCNCFLLHGELNCCLDGVCKKNQLHNYFVFILL